MPAVNHRVEHAAAGLVADAVPKLAAGANVLHGAQVAALVVHRGEAVAGELPGDVRHAIARALLDLRRRVGGPRADLVEGGGGEIRHPAVQLAGRVLVVGAAHRVGRVLGDAGHGEGLAVVEVGVPAAMADDHRVVRGHFVEIVDVERPLVAQLGVVEEVALDPRARRRLLRPLPKLADDAADADEFDLEGIADEHLVQQHFPAGMVMAVDEAGDHRHAFGIERLGALAGEALDVAGRADGREPPAEDGKRLRPWRSCVHRVDLGVDDD